MANLMMGPPYDELGARLVRILVVDDEPDIREIIEMALLDMGEDVEVLTAGNGKLGLEVLKETPVDLVIADFSMPGMTGLEMLENAKGIHNGRAMLLTAFKKDQDAIAAAQQGLIQRYLNKPPKIEALQEMVRELVLPDEAPS